jgi:hypothetical protein
MHPGQLGLAKRFATSVENWSAVVKNTCGYLDKTDLPAVIWPFGYNQRPRLALAFSIGLFSAIGGLTLNLPPT